MIAPKERRLWQRHHRLLQEQDSKESSKGRWRRKPHALDQEEKIHRGTACIVLFMVNPFPDFTPKAVGGEGIHESRFKSLNPAPSLGKFP